MVNMEKKESLDIQKTLMTKYNQNVLLEKRVFIASVYMQDG